MAGKANRHRLIVRGKEGEHAGVLFYMDRRDGRLAQGSYEPVTEARPTGEKVTADNRHPAVVLLGDDGRRYLRFGDYSVRAV